MSIIGEKLYSIQYASMEHEVVSLAAPQAGPVHLDVEPEPSKSNDPSYPVRDTDLRSEDTIGGGMLLNLKVGTSNKIMFVRLSALLRIM